MTPEDLPGLFISLEGNEGAGKTTQVKLLTQYLTQRGCRWIQVRDPGGTYVGEVLRRLIKEDPEARDCDHVTELLLFAAARRELVAKTIEPALRSGMIVVADRFHHSTMVYQGYGRGIPLLAVSHAISLATNGIIPDITLLLDIPVEVGIERLKKEGRPDDRFDSAGVDFLNKIRSGYADLCRKDYRMRHIDCTHTPEYVFDRVIANLRTNPKFELLTRTFPDAIKRKTVDEFA